MRRAGVLALAVSALVLVAGCGNGLDSTPENQSGHPSTEFESDDIEAAESASALVATYCQGAESEAQEVGCLAHVSEAEVCKQDTNGKQFALEAYIEETGEDPC